MEHPSTSNGLSIPLIDDLLENAWAQPMGKERLQALSEGAHLLCERMIAFGSAAFERIGQHGETPQEDYDDMMITYSWSLSAKATLLLWRDIVFRHHQALLAFDRNEVDEEGLSNLAERSRQILERAGLDLNQKATRPSDSIRQLNKAVKSWSLQANPWPVYKDQLKAIAGQCSDLVTANNLLRQLAEQIARLAKSIDQTLDLTIQDLALLGSHLDQIQEDLTAIPEKVTKTSIQKVLTRIDSVDTFSRGAIVTNPFLAILDKFLTQLPDDLLIPMDLQGGSIQTREIRIRRSFRTWLEAELMPLIYEIIETRDEHHSGIAIVLTNLKNRLAATLEGAGNLHTPQQRQELSHSLKDRRDSIPPARDSMILLRKEVMSRLETSTNVRDMQHADRSFLAMPLESSLQRMTDQSSALSSMVSSRFRKIWNVLLTWQRQALREESLSVGERLLRYIKSHTPDPTAEMYTSLFLTGGFVGDALLVSRQSELKRIRHCLAEWREGYRGTVLLTGGRFSGKTMFVESFSRNHFPSATIRLQPGQPISLGGRTFTPEYDLEPALEFIGKYALQSRAMVWIDDLENWSEAGATLNRNVRHLVRFMDTHSPKLFFVVSTNRILLPHLDRTHGLARSCQAIIHLDQLDPEHLQNAILIRHGATHKSLVDENGQQVETEQFVREIRQLHRFTQGNIGIALYSWASRIRVHSDQEVRMAEASTYRLPLVMDARSFPLFRVLLLYRHVNEYRLRKLFGPNFDIEFSPIVRRWLSLGVLKRSPEGWLEIHPIVAYELIKQLELYSAEPIYSESTLTAYGKH